MPYGTPGVMDLEGLLRVSGNGRRPVPCGASTNVVVWYDAPPGMRRPGSGCCIALSRSMSGRSMVVGAMARYLRFEALKLCKALLDGECPVRSHDGKTQKIYSIS